MQTFRRYLPWLVLVSGVLYVGSSMRPQPTTVAAARAGFVGRTVGMFYPYDPLTPQDRMELAGFGTLPISDHGRIKPIDTYARVELMMMNRRQEFKDPKDKSQPAIRWFLNLLADGKIDSIGTVTLAPDVAAWLGLQPGRDGRLVFAAEEVAEAADAKMARRETPQGEQAVGAVLDAKDRAARTKRLRAGLYKDNNPEALKVFRIDYDQLLEMLKLERREGLRYSVQEITHSDDPAKRPAFAAFFRKAMQAKDVPADKRDTTENRVLELFKQLSTHRAVASLQGVALVPDRDFSPEGWTTLGQALQGGDPANPNARHLDAMVTAYAAGDADEFNKQLAGYREAVTAAMPTEAMNARREAWFNQFAPFYRCANLYVMVLVLAFLSWVVWPKEMWLSAVLLLGLTLAVHSYALVMRMAIQGRPPVVNLYSSAVFIGWGCTVVCMLMELMYARMPMIYRNAIPSAVAGLLGFGTMVIAHHLGGSGDTLEMMQAVLDTNFWLATHVTTVTLGYTATFVAGFIAIVFLWWMLASTVLAYFRNRGNPEWSNVLPFVAACVGLVAIPGTLAVGLLWGMYYQWAGDDPFTVKVAIPMMLPVLVAGAIYAVMLVIRYTSPEATPAGEVPAMLGWAQGLNLNVNVSKSFMNAIYGVTCLALLLSFVGTVLGGIWADQSWGRFWGWDPKENGAILVVIVNALLLHARWGGMIRERGTVIIALLGNMVTM
ncbi:MAG: cytochrome c biogenesis protein, partial [Gemmataceae bacterium]